MFSYVLPQQQPDGEPCLQWQRITVLEAHDTAAVEPKLFSEFSLR
jgi:hypothetical protein